jgi:hypothetical protein
VKAYNFHLRRYLKTFFPKKALESVDEFLLVSDPEVISTLHKVARDPAAPGYLDARCIIFRQHRFRAIALPESMTEKDLIGFKKSANIKDQNIEWEFFKVSSLQERLLFPVSRRHVIVQKASQCSDLLSKIPSKQSNWVYIAPENDLALINFLENWSS